MKQKPTRSHWSTCRAVVVTFIRLIFSTAVSSDLTADPFHKGPELAAIYIDVMAENSCESMNPGCMGTAMRTLPMTLITEYPDGTI